MRDRPRPPLPDYVDTDTGEVFSPSQQRALVRAESTDVANPFTGAGFMPPLSWLRKGWPHSGLGMVEEHRLAVREWMEDLRACGFLEAWDAKDIPSPDEVIECGKAGMPGYSHTEGRKQANKEATA